MRFRLVLGFCALSLAAVAEVSAEPVPAIETANGPFFSWQDFAGPDNAGTVGWSFQVIGSYDLRVHALGVFDFGQDGLAEPHAVGLWDDTGTSLLAHLTIPSGTAAPLVGSYRYQNLVQPKTLMLGKVYVFGEHFESVSLDRISNSSNQTFFLNLLALESRQTPLTPESDFSFPNLDAGVPEGIFGPNFLLTRCRPGAALVSPSRTRLSRPVGRSQTYRQSALNLAAWVPG